MKKHCRQHRSGKQYGLEDMKRSLCCSRCNNSEVRDICSHRKNTAAITKGQDNAKDHHQCDDCGDEFAKHDTLLLHRPLHSKKDPYKCDVCKRTFARKYNLKNHLTSSSHCGVKSHRCDDCGKVFAHHRYLVAHRRVHQNEKPFRCQECGKTFHILSHLRNHFRLHSVRVRVHCDASTDVRV